MSFFDIPGRIEELQKHLKSRSNQMVQFNEFLKITKRFMDQYVKNQTIQKDQDDSLILIIQNTINEFFQQVSEISQNVQLQIIESMEQFMENFQSSNWQMIQNLLKIKLQWSKAKKEVDTNKQEYQNIMLSLSKANQEMGKIPKTNKQKIQSLSKKIKQQEDISEKVTFRYNQSIKICNIQLQYYEDEEKKILEKLQQNEESRLHFFKLCFQKCSLQMQKFGQIMINSSDKIEKELQNFSIQQNIQNLIDQVKETNQEMEYQQFQDYQKQDQNQSSETQPKRLKKSSSYADISNSMQNMNLILLNIVKQLFEESEIKKEMDVNSYEQLMNYLLIPKAQIVYIDILQE